MQYLTTSTSIKQVFPDIEDELCNRHTVHMTRIKRKFQELYQGCQPGVFVVAKGLCQLGSCLDQNNGKQRQCNSFMTVQNSITIALQKTAPTTNIYLNYSTWQNESQQLQLNEPHQSHQSQQPTQQLQQQLILTYKGQILNAPNLSDNSRDLSMMLAEVYRLAIEDLSLGKICGGVLYVDSKLEQGCFYQREALIWAFYVAILQLNSITQQYTIPHIQHTLLTSKLPNTNPHKLSTYSQILPLSLSLSPSSQKYIIINNNLHASTHRFVMCKLRSQGSFQKNKVGDFFGKVEQRQLELLGKLEEGDIGVGEFCGKVRDECLGMVNGEVEQWVLGFVDKFIKPSCGIFLTQQHSYMALLTPPSQIPDLINTLSKHLKSTSTSTSNSTPEDILQKPTKMGKWNRNKNLDQFLFSTGGCVGLSILDPTQEIWYCQ